MRILVVSQSFYPDNFKINDVIKDLSDAGHQVHVLTGLGDYSTGKIPSRYRWFKNRTEQYNGATIKRVRTISRRTGPIFRALNYLSFAFFGCIWGFFTKTKFDVVYIYQPSPVTMVFPGRTVARKQNIPLVIYCLDIWPESVKAMHIQEGNVVYRMITRLSQWAYQSADEILVSSFSFMDYLNEVDEIPMEKMKYLPQHAEDVVMGQRTVPEMIIEQCDKVNFVFTGNIGMVQDVETIVLATKQLPKELPYKIHIVGDGSNLATCKSLADEYAVNDKIHFYGRQPAEMMQDFYEIADACLLTLKNENKIGLTIPAKLQGYMAAGKPIVAAINGDSQTIIADADCGMCVSSSDADALAKAIQAFIELPKEIRESYGANSRSYYEKHFTKETFIESTLEVLENVGK